MTTMLLSVAFALTPREPLPPMPLATQGPSALAEGPPRVLVKLKDGARAASVDADLKPLVHHDVSELVARAEARSGRAQPDYGTLFIVVPPKGVSLQSVASALQADEDVEIAWTAPELVPPPKRPGKKKGPTEPAESYLKLQRYHLAEHGVGSRDAWKAGYTGKGIRISDIEYGMNLRHEDIAGGRIAHEKGLKVINPFSEHHDHGTAVMGIAVGEPDKAGIRGIAHGAKGGFYPINTEQHGYRPTDALLKACKESNAGDLVMIELQTVAYGNYAPMEVEPGMWMATRTCSDAGVVVVAAAGNGSQDLDRKDFDPWRDRGDSGAIMVGAALGAKGSREAEDFSNYGKRVDLQGWGSGVFSLGYGDHSLDDGDYDQAYTARFSGTSSATPIVAGAAALVQQAAVETTGEPLSPEDLRALLRKTGRKHQGKRRVGELPDVMKAIAKLPKKKAPKERDDAGKADVATTEAKGWHSTVFACSTGPAAPGWLLVGLLGLITSGRRR